MAMRNPRICISAGHGIGSRKPGVKDPGAVALGREEADVVLSLARDVVADLNALRYRGMWAMLRDGGVYFTADDDAAKAGCQVFLELHLNAGPIKATGTETLVSDHSTAGSKRFARLMQERLVAALGRVDRGVKQRGDLAVLKPHDGMVSCLPEVCFITNPKDMAAYKLNRTKVELAVLNAVLAYCGWREVKFAVPRLWGPIRRARYKPY